MPGDHMSPDEFRRLGHDYVDWVASYWERVADLPVQSPVSPGDVLAGLPATPPAQGEGLDSMLADLDRHVVPGLTNWQHPSFFAFFPANTSGPGVLADIISSGLGVNGMNWATSPACTEVEMVMLDWFVELLGLPDHFRHGRTGRGAGCCRTRHRRRRCARSSPPGTGSRPAATCRSSGPTRRTRPTRRS